MLYIEAKTIHNVQNTQDHYYKINQKIIVRCAGYSMQNELKCMIFV